MVFNKKKQNFIQQNPIVLEIEGMEHRFSHIDLLKGRPNAHRAMFQAVASFRTKEDWANLAPLLAGYKKAGVKVKADEFFYISRKAVAGEGTYAIIECARHAADTGFYLARPSATALLLYLSSAERDPRKASIWLDEILDIMARSPHKEKAAWNIYDSLTLSGLSLSIRLAAVQAQDPAAVSERDMNNLRDEASALSALWSKQLSREENRDQLDLDEHGLRPFIMTTKATEEMKAERVRLSPFVYLELMTRNIDALEKAPAVVGEPDDVFRDACRLLDDHITATMLERVGANTTDATGSLRLPRLAAAYQETRGQKPTWAEPQAPSEAAPEAAA